MMTDTAVGFAIVGIAMLVVLVVVFIAFSRGGPADPRPKPPSGVHLPNPSYLPVVLSLGGALLGAGLAFRNEGQIANPFIAIPGAVVFVLGAIWWVRAANHEWNDTEHGSHGDDAGH
jgi:hypothetical protein